ncbi:hypothetical protein HK101_002397 [Irineochytrium annulatum]|nr:hypothetical protein HK101_002397 [Irineochytrium annulatum]
MSPLVSHLVSLLSRARGSTPPRLSLDSAPSTSDLAPLKRPDGPNALLPHHDSLHGPTTPPPSVPLFPQRHPKRSLVCIFLLLVSGARVSSIMNAHHPTAQFPQEETAASAATASVALPPPMMAAATPAAEMPTLVVTDNLVYRSHLMDASHPGNAKKRKGTKRPVVDEAEAEVGGEAISGEKERVVPVPPRLPAFGSQNEEAGEDVTLPVMAVEDVPSYEDVAAEAPAYVRQPTADQVIAPEVGMEFMHGVASGDALADSVIIWTRVTPPVNHKNPSRQHPSFLVRYDVSLSAETYDTTVPGTPPSSIGPILFSGMVATGPEVDYTVKVELKNLQPATSYFYQFTVQSTDPATLKQHTARSPAGVTRTLPSAHAQLSLLNLAVVSCSNLPVGFFNAYANIASRSDVDVVVHLGDYFYEYRNGEYGDGADLGRVPTPDRELVSVEDYRERHRQYKEDPDLQGLHRVKPWIVIWDDHEFLDNVAGGDDAAWDHPRMPSALRAYFEYLPIRESTLHAGIHRSFRFGNLLDLIMLDTRIHGRDASGETNATLLQAESRTILGEDQERWFENELVESRDRGAAWRFVGNQVVFAPMDKWGLKINLDAWDGYPKNRERVMDFIQKENIEDIVVLTGDIHTSLAFNVPVDPWDTATFNSTTGAGSLLVEFVSPAVTSPSPLESINLGLLNPVAERVLMAAEPHLHFIDLSRRGYMVVRVCAERVTVEYWYPRSIRVRRHGDEVLGAVMETERGSKRITKAKVFPK